MCLEKEKNAPSADKEKELTSKLAADLQKNREPSSTPIAALGEEEEASSAHEADLERRKGTSSLLLADLEKVFLATDDWTTTFLTQSRSTQSERCNGKGVQKEPVEKPTTQDTGEQGGLRAVSPGGNKLVLPITSSNSVTGTTSAVPSNAVPSAIPSDTAISAAAHDQLQPLTQHGSQGSNERQAPSAIPPGTAASKQGTAASKQVKKQLLLAKLMAIDSGGDPNNVSGGDQRELLKQELGWDIPLATTSSTTTVAKQPNHGHNDAASYRPSFGRRARAAELKTISPQINQSNKIASPSLFFPELHQSPYSTPPPRQPNTKSKQSSIFGDGSAHLTLRAGAQARPAAMATKDIIPGAITTEPEDLEELAL